MAEPNVATEKPKDAYELVIEEHDDSFKSKGTHSEEDLTLHGVLSRLISAIFIPNPDTSYASTPLIHRIKPSLSDNVPLLREASRNTGSDVLLWTRRGSPLRALLVVSVGTITLLALTGVLLFMLFFVAATFNVIAISLLVSIAAAGGFLAIFFACLTAIYIWALSVVVFVISTITISATIAALIAAGWIGLIWSVWFVTKKSIGLATHSFRKTGTALSTYYSSARHHREGGKVSD